MKTAIHEWITPTGRNIRKIFTENREHQALSVSSINKDWSIIDILSDAKKAESLIVNSVGQRPTKRNTNIACKRLTGLRPVGASVCGMIRSVGRCPTLLIYRLSA